MTPVYVHGRGDPFGPPDTATGSTPRLADWLVTDPVSCQPIMAVQAVTCHEAGGGSDDGNRFSSA